MASFWISSLFMNTTDIIKKNYVPSLLATEKRRQTQWQLVLKAFNSKAGLLAWRSWPPHLQWFRLRQKSLVLEQGRDQCGN